MIRQREFYKMAVLTELSKPPFHIMIMKFLSSGKFSTSSLTEKMGKLKSFSYIEREGLGIVFDCRHMIES